ncbi:PQQ-dependent sugar dehydrogenase [Hymenobacter sp. GOD-10R]|uniref:PQQ-dependent sugar dehydrogenase n=1 Tax=Hymenobacter sp. GOD-10R TaxID=3093922 RepID=UPI002D77C44B|nr:PQQ-dependent sugar dehydrogenase [Hymenobacter sp. GOD-10R]WRQ30059.1 PQQ-dependent sugar dehydrogenase [Hymenobacter sp. GOD-10R]
MRQKLILFTALLTLLFQTVSAQNLTGPRGEVFSRRIVARQLSDPWEVTYGPDNYLWVTEAKGYRVSRINPADGSKQVLLDISKERQFPRYDKIPESIDGGKPWPQGGLMGMALHPQLLQGKPYVYLVYLYRFANADVPGKGGKPNYGGYYFTTRLVRYEYNPQAQKLGNPVTLCDTIPGSSDHNGGRLAVAPVEGKDYLFYGIGDLGAGQFDNGGRPNHAQQTNYYEGKILRFNLEPDADTNASDKWVPNDNPFSTAVRQNAVWTYGNRNPQGLAYAVIGGVGHLYSSEHGPFSDDEVNLLERGKNYGHPLVLGYNDNNYNGLAAGVSEHAMLPGVWHTTYPFIKSENENAKAIGASYRDPIKTLYPNSNAFLNKLFVKTRNHDPDTPEWPSEAPSNIAVYTAAAIPGWQNSLLLPTLKHGKLIRLQLNAAGTGVVGDTLTYFRAPVRYRDLAFSPDGTKIYLATDSSSVTSGPSKEDPQGTNCKGCLVEFTYQSGGSSPKPSPSSSKAPAPKTAIPTPTSRRRQ